MTEAELKLEIAIILYKASVLAMQISVVPGQVLPASMPLLVH